MTKLDLRDHPPIDWPTFKQLADKGVPAACLVRLTQVRIVAGTVAEDGLLNLDERGQPFLAFFEQAAHDVVFWNIGTGRLATWQGRAFALGADNIANATTYAFDNHLHIYPDALQWLAGGGRGIVVLSWRQAFDMLRDAPRVAVAEALLPTYRAAMKARHLPELSVVVEKKRQAA